MSDCECQSPSACGPSSCLCCWPSQGMIWPMWFESIDSVVFLRIDWLWSTHALSFRFLPCWIWLLDRRCLEWEYCRIMFWNAIDRFIFVRYPQLCWSSLGWVRDHWLVCQSRISCVGPSSTASSENRLRFWGCSGLSSCDWPALWKVRTSLVKLYEKAYRALILSLTSVTSDSLERILRIESARLVFNRPKRFSSSIF